MTTLEAVVAEAARMRDTVGYELYSKACTEIDRAVPPWAKRGVITMDAEGIHALMVASWLRGHAAALDGAQ